ncbi:hypothetical protein [Gluconobacter thailandicus]
MDRGVFLVRRKLQDCRQVTAQDDRQFAVGRLERDLRDERAQALGRLGFRLFGLKTLIKRRDPLLVDLRHVRMEKGRWLLGIGDLLFQFLLAGFEHRHFFHDPLGCLNVI